MGHLPYFREVPRSVRDVPGQQRATGELGKRAIGFRKDAIFRHSGRQTAPPAGLQHRGTKTEPTPDIDGALQISETPREPVEHGNSRFRIVFKLI